MSGPRHGNVFVISGPSGVGKSTIVKKVLEADPQVRFSVSHTTRPPRGGERDEVDYHFIKTEDFLRLRDAGVLLEHAVYQGNYYGTSREAVERPTHAGYDLILEVEIQGAEQLQKVLPDAVRVFIEPPSPEALEVRLRERRTETDEVMRSRLVQAREEMAYARQCQHRIVNESVDKAVDELLRIIREARERRR
jgi:guanylate kinase